MSASRFDRLKIRAVAMISTSSPGCRLVSRCIRAARKTLPNPSGAPIRTVPETVCADSAAALAERKALSMPSAAASRFSPASVSA